METAKSLLNVVYYYNGKLCGLYGGEHRQICLKNFEIGDNYICFKENESKTFVGGLLDLKYELCVMRHICHSVGEHHEPCLIEYYRLYCLLPDMCGLLCFTEMFHKLEGVAAILKKTMQSIFNKCTV